MNRKSLEVALAYAEREREFTFGPKVVPTERPDWLIDGCVIASQADGSRRIVLIGGDRVCLTNTYGNAEMVPMDTSEIVNGWGPVHAPNLAAA